MSHLPELKSIDSLRGRTDLEALLSLNDDLSIFKVDGEDHSRAALVTVMLHGNEPCGFRAMLKEINECRNYPADLYWLVGNVKAAQLEPYFTTRVVPNEQNFNRIWVAEPITEAERQAQNVFEYFKTNQLLGMLDIHSFTPTDTPAHGFIGDISEQSLRLARKLAPHAFVIDNPMGTIAERLAPYTPSISVECGTNGTLEADAYAYNVLQRFFIEVGMFPRKTGGEQTGSESTRPDDNICQGVYGNMTNLKILPQVRPVWAAERDAVADITIRPDVSKLNITEIPAETFYAYASRLEDLFIIRQGGREIPAKQVFDFRDGALYFRKAYVPNLMSPVEKIQKESGCYLFTPLNVV